jgi:hypothetical protein
MLKHYLLIDITLIVCYSMDNSPFFPFSTWQIFYFLISNFKTYTDFSFVSFY